MEIIASARLSICLRFSCNKAMTKLSIACGNHVFDCFALRGEQTSLRLLLEAMDYEYLSNAITQRRPMSSHRSSFAISTESNENNLKRSLNLVDLVFYGVGCSVGAGIYSLVGIGARLAGPSIAGSFAICGVACCFTSLSYAEFAARVPAAGSAYVFTYVSFGELCGWLVGWNLTLGYAISAAVVARSWAQYVVGFLQGVVDYPDILHWMTHAAVPGLEYECCPLAMIIIGLCTAVLVTGAKESTQFNIAMTVLNLAVLGFVFLAGLTSGSVVLENLIPVFPHGVTGMAQGAGLVFFAYLGFDMVSCLSEEVMNPARNMPIGIMGSLFVSMSIYVAVSLVVVGMAPVSLLGEETPIVQALLANACCSHHEQTSLSDAKNVCLAVSCSPILRPVLYLGSRIVSFGAIFGLTAATFACLMGQPRIFFSMAQDGLMFKIYARVHPKSGVPSVGTILTGILTALIACFIDLEPLANAISLGTLQVFTFVNAGVIILRMRTAVGSTFLEDRDIATEESSLLGTNQTLARTMGLVPKKTILLPVPIRRSPAEVEIQDSSKPHILTFIFTIGCLLFSAGFTRDWHLIILSMCATIVVLSSVLLFQIPQSAPPTTFACPWVPFVPLMGILSNAFMMGSMSVSSRRRLKLLSLLSFSTISQSQVATWTIMLAWLFAGLLFYFCYGLHHSELRAAKASAL